MNTCEFLKVGDTIGLITPSMPLDKRHLIRTNSAVEHFKRLGYNVEFATHALCQVDSVRSAEAVDRARDFEEMYTRQDIKCIFSLSGGEVMMEMLDYIDFEKLKKYPPKFFVGYSDNTNLCLTLTTLLGIPSVYAYCFPSFGMKRWHKSLNDVYSFLCGNKTKFDSYAKFESSKEHSHKRGGELDGFKLTSKTDWKILSGKDEQQFEGVAIGGCLDILILLCGTKYDKVREYVNKQDKVIWFVESCDLNIMCQYRALWQLKQAGWFNNCSGIVIGRPLNKQKMWDMDYKQANYKALMDLNVPVIIDADFGHTNPKIPIVFGVKTRVSVKNGKGSIDYSI